MNTSLPSMPTLASRYRATLSHAWARRALLQGPALRVDEAAFLPAALSLQHTPVHPAPRRTAWAVMALLGCALAWACTGTVDIVAVAPGRIVVHDRNKLVQPLERSVVRRILVRDGDHVQEGQALVELDPTGAQADKTNSEEQSKSARSDTLRAAALLQALHGPAPLPSAPPALTLPIAWNDAERNAARSQLAAEWNDIAARLARFAAEIQRRRAEIGTVVEMAAKIEATLPLLRQREHDIQALASQGFMASHAGQDRTRERIELERDLLTQRARLHEAQAALQESEQARAAYVAETRRSLSDREALARLKQQQATQEHAKASHREALTTLRAPASGTVQQLSTHTVGGVVTEAQALMVIVPDGSAGEPLVAEVMLDNKDIGFVNAGQSAEIKLETFPFTRYGTVAAQVQMVTADAVQDDKRGAVFPARLQLLGHTLQIDGRPIRLAAGMNLSAEIRTGRRLVIDYLLSPVQQARAESLRER